MSRKLRDWIASPAETRIAWLIATGCVVLIIVIALRPAAENGKNRKKAEQRYETRQEAKQSSGSIEKIIEKVQEKSPEKTESSSTTVHRTQPVKPEPAPKKRIAATTEKPKPRPATSLPEGYYVQLGAFSKLHGAETLRNKLSPSLNNIHLKKKSNSLTAVWAGPYASKSEAYKAKTEIAGKTKIKGFVVKH